MHRSEYFSEWAFSRELASRAFESREAPVNVIVRAAVGYSQFPIAARPPIKSGNRVGGGLIVGDPGRVASL